MNGLEALAITSAGAVAGAVNAVVGSGSLVTFPTLVALGYPPVTANVSNTVGLVPGSISGSIGYRRELRGQWRRVVTLDVGTATGALLGGVLLLELPSAVFDAVVPILILLACVLMALRPAHPGRPRGARRVPHRHLRRLLRRGAGDHPARDPPPLLRRRPPAPQRGQ